MQDLARGAACADAGWYGGECCNHDHTPQDHGEQLPERRDGHRIVVEGLGQSDSPGEPQDGAGEGGKYLCR